MHSRRDILRLASAANFAVLGTPYIVRRAAAQPVRPPASPALTHWLDPLPVPPVVSATGIGTLTARSYSSHKFHTELPGNANTFGFGGADYLGPTIEARRGTPASITVSNQLGAHPLAGSIDTALHGAVPADATAPRISTHLHGGNTEAGSDGFPEDTFAPGGSKTYSYANDQQAGNIWYHDHALGITRLNVYAGLAGVYLMRDAVDTGAANNPLGLPSGAFEIPLVLQDRRFNADGTLYYTPAPWAPEFFGDVATVNGKAWPNLDVGQGLYRFRVYNGSSARFYNLSLSNRQQMVQIGTDTGLLDAPAPLSAVLLGPGERADLLIDFKALPVGTKVVLQNDAVTPFPSGTPRNPRAGGAPLPQVMQFTVVAAAQGPGNTLAVPTGPLRDGVALPTVAASRTALAGRVAKVRNLTLVEVPGPAGPLVVLLNYLYWDEASMDSRFAEKPLVDTVERWNIINLTVDAHPIHLHLVQFLIEQRQNLQTTQYLKAYNATGPRTVTPGMSPPPAGGPTVPAGYPPLDPTPFLQQRPVPPAASEAGWKDTVQCPPDMVTSILVPFGGRVANGAFGRSFTGRYVWHCHILDHEDNEMMLPYEVVGA